MNDELNDQRRPEEMLWDAVIDTGEIPDVWMGTEASHQFVSKLLGHPMARAAFAARDAEEVQTEGLFRYLGREGRADADFDVEEAARRLQDAYDRVMGDGPVKEALLEEDPAYFDELVAELDRRLDVKREIYDALERAKPLWKAELLQQELAEIFADLADELAADGMRVRLDGGSRAMSELARRVSTPEDSGGE